MDELRTEISLPTTKPPRRRTARTPGCEDCQAETREMRDRIEDVTGWAEDLQQVAATDLPGDMLRGVVTAMAFAIEMKANDIDSELTLQTCERCWWPAFKTYAELHPDPPGGGSIPRDALSGNPEPFPPGI